jgi:hypothetical protein
MSKLLHHLTRWWHLSSAVNALLVELVPSVETPIVELNVGIRDPCYRAGRVTTLFSFYQTSTRPTQ